LFVSFTFSSFSHQETCLHQSYKAKAPSAKAAASHVHLEPDKVPNKKSTSIKDTSPSKPSIAATMDMSISSDSSLSSTNGGYYAILPDVSDFVPTSLPTGHGTIPIDVKHLCQIAHAVTILTFGYGRVALLILNKRYENAALVSQFKSYGPFLHKLFPTPQNNYKPPQILLQTPKPAPYTLNHESSRL
jgi:hypothetical protein